MKGELKTISSIVMLFLKLRNFIQHHIVILYKYVIKKPTITQASINQFDSHTLYVHGSVLPEDDQI